MRGPDRYTEEPKSTRYTIRIFDFVVRAVLAVRFRKDETSRFSFHYPPYANQGGTPGASVRCGDWKLIRFFEDSHEELYNLAEDIGETRNLAASAPDRRAELSEMLTEWQREIEAIIPETNPDYERWEGCEPCGHFAEDGGSEGGGRSGGGRRGSGSKGGPGGLLGDAAVSDPGV